MQENNTPRALVIDDSRMERLFLSKILEKLGVESDSADGGESGIQLFPTKDYDILFIDHLMPHMDGIRTLQRLGEKTAVLEKNVPAVILGKTEDLEKDGMYQKAGFSEALEKPVGWEELLDCLKRLLPEEKQELVGTQAGEEEEEDEEEMDLPEWLSECPDIDLNEGIKNCGSEEGFLSALGIFYSTIRAKSDEIEKYYNEEDWENYTIKVHALKSSARIIGAMELSALAKKMEDAGNAGEIGTIRENTGMLLVGYRGYQDVLKKLDGDGEEEADLPDAPPEKIQDAYQAIQMFGADMDFDMVEMVLGQMKEFKLSEADKEAFAKINDALMNLDWDAIAEEVKGRLG